MIQRKTFSTSVVMALMRQRLGRNDRHVRHARLCIDAGAPRHKLAFNIEEALRLCSLPGENEGRVYFFRRLFIGGLPEDGDRRAWLEVFQRALLEPAGRAVHGMDGAAPAANAVFFLNEQQACESLLVLILRGRPADAWFWPAVSGSTLGASPATVVVSLIEKLLGSPASWLAVAAAIFGAIGQGGAAMLLKLLPDATVRQWLIDLGDADATHAVAPIPFQESTRTVVEQAAAALGPQDPRVLWLASLAVVLASPSELDRGTVASRARMGLGGILPIDPSPSVSRAIGHRLPGRRRVQPNPGGLAADNERGERAIAHDARFSSHLREILAIGSKGPEIGSLRRVRFSSLEQQPDQAPAESERSHPASGHEQPSQRREPLAENLNGDDAWPAETADAIAEDDATSRAPAPADDGSRPDRCLGEATQGAGLYFLLNALRYLKSDHDDFDLSFLAHFFQRAARHAGIESDDPILIWTLATLDEIDAPEVDERMLRLWLLKVRRWCWRSGKITVKEIVRRPGRVTLTRIDLDVSLALDAVDIRIRRIGLDLDPGWVPWFGRVVRFHYLGGGELHA
jgi:hypothetical protein